MSAVEFFLPHLTATVAGIAIPGAQFEFLQTGTTTPLTVYSDSGLTIPRTNPVVCNGVGALPTTYLDNTKTYRLRIYDESGALLDGGDIDPFIPGTFPDASVLQPYADAASNSANAASSSAASAGSSAATALAALSSLAVINNATAHAATRTVLAALNTALGPAYLTEAGREGTFVFDSANHAAHVTADPQQGIYVAPSSDTTGASGAWVRKAPANRLTPYMFGALGGYTTPGAAMGGIDDTVACQALLNFWTNNPQFVPDFLGLHWATTAEITIQQTISSSVQVNPAIMMGGTFVPKTGTTGTRIVTINAPGAHIVGHIGAIGPGDTVAANTINYASRSWDYGIYLVDSHQIRIDSWSAANVKCWGFDAATEDFANLGNRSNVNGSNIGVRVGPGNCFNCGSAAGQANSSCLTYTFDSITYNGTAGSVNQTSTCHATTALDPKIAVGDNFCMTSATTGARLSFQISAIDFVANTVTFLFWLPLGTYAGTVATAWTMDSAHGGFLHIHGGNSGESTYGGVEGIRAGVGLKDSGLYGSYIASVHTEASGINECRGNGPNATTRGGATWGKHDESTFLNTVHRGTTPTRRVSGPASAYGLTSATEFTNEYYASPLNTSGVPTLLGQDGKIAFGEQGLVQNEGGPGNPTSIPTTITLTNRDLDRYWRGHYPVSGANTLTFNIDWKPEYAFGWTGKHWMGFECSGVQGTNNALTQVTVQLTAALVTAGYTLNGGTAAIVITGMRGPIRGRIIFDFINKNFIFTYVDDMPNAPVVLAITSAGTITPTFGTDLVKVTALAANTTLANPTGTAVPGKLMRVRIKDAGVSKTIAYGTQYRALGVTLPVATTISKTLYLTMIYNSDDTKWDVIDVKQEA